MSSERKFAEKVIEELRRQGVTEPLVYEEEHSRIAAGTGQYFMLGNAHPAWEQTSRLRRGALVREFVSSLLEQPPLPESAAEARPNLMPRVHELEYFEVLKLRFADARDGRGPALVYRPLNDELGIEVVYDHPRSVSSLDPATLEGWGISEEEALRTARANLRERTPGTLQQIALGTYVSARDDTYDAARLLLTELISRLELAGDPVALLPHRDRLFVTGSEDADGLRLIALEAEPLLEQPRYETGRAYVWRGGEWQPFVPAEGHPAARAFEHLRRLSAAATYADQAGALQERLTAAGEDVFVASVMAFDDDGETITVASWTKTVLALLPRADRVMFVVLEEDGEPETVLVRWDDAVEIAGRLMQPQGLLPERWRVDGFPSGEELARLRERAV